jgi:hypothetical protein
MKEARPEKNWEVGCSVVKLGKKLIISSKEHRHRFRCNFACLF